MANLDKLTTWAQRYADSLVSKPQARLPQVPQSNPVSAPNIPTTPVNFERAYFLSGDFGKEFLREYAAKIKADYGNASALNVLNWSDSKNCVTGSNPFSVTLVNQMLRPQNIRTATQADLERIATGNILPLKGNHYEDSALVYRNDQDPNEYLAKNIRAELSRTGFIILQGGAPVVVPLHALNVVKNDNSPHKLKFEIVDSTAAVAAHILSSKNGSYINPAEMDNRGLPSKVYQNSVAGSNRQLWTRDSGLSRLYLNRDLSVNSGNGNLANSNDYGRVVLVSAAGVAPKNLGGTK